MKHGQPSWNNIAWLLLGICLAPIAAAGSEPRSIRQSLYESSTPRSDAPNDVTSTAQTLDGFLWIGTRHGLYRFYGTVFNRIDREHDAGSQKVQALLASENGDLWIVYSSVIRLVSPINLFGTSAIEDRITFDRAGNLWGSDNFTGSFDIDATSAALRRELITTIRGVHQGLRHLQPQASEITLGTMEDAVSPQEVEVLQIPAIGNSNKCIANALGVSEETVKTHMKSSLAKFRVTDRFLAARVVASQGFLEL